MAARKEKAQFLQCTEPILLSVGTLLDSTRSFRNKDNIPNETQEYGFHVLQIYARPIAKDVVELENSDNDTKENEHILIILSGIGRGRGTNGATYYQYLFDRKRDVGVRFVKVNMVENELLSRGYILIKDIQCKSYSPVRYKSDIRQFMIDQSIKPFNAGKNNSVHFAFNFLKNIQNKIKSHVCSDYNEFIQRITSKPAVKKSRYGQTENKFVQKLLGEAVAYQNHIHLPDDLKKKLQLSWKLNDRLLFLSYNCKGRKSYHISTIIKIQHEFINVQFNKLGNTFREPLLKNSHELKPFIEIPSKYLDPITKKIMTDPVQILKSGTVYDKITVQYLQKYAEQELALRDPVNGVLISINQQKPICILKKKLKEKIKTFIKVHGVKSKIINDFKSVHNKAVWDIVWKKLDDKYDVKKQQQKSYKKSIILFYPENQSKSNYDDEKKNDQNILKWNTDHMFINHSCIPIITCMGPSRIGKSFLLNEILRTQPNWKNNEGPSTNDVFETSKSSDQPLTKGALLSLYGNIYTDEDLKNDDNQPHQHVFLVDQFPEDDITMWSTDIILIWLHSLSKDFNKIYSNVIDYIKRNKINGANIGEIINKDLLMKEIQLNEKYSNLLINILDKRLRNKTDEIDADKISQMYLVDMEGLSHGITPFTIKLFEGCYAISNVIIWYDIEVNSHRFKTLMKTLKENMKIVSTSNRKPAFLYVLRNADQLDFDFTVYGEAEEDDDNDDTDDDKFEEFDFYIKNSDSFKYLHQMNIFSSIHGYELDSPILKKKKKRKKRYYKEETLNALLNKIKLISNKTARFINNSNLLTEQLNSINKECQLSIEQRAVLCNSRLQWFVFGNNEEKKQLQMKNAIIECDYNTEKVESYFDQGYKSVSRQLEMRKLEITQKLKSELTENKKKIIKEIDDFWEERKKEKDSYKRLGRKLKIAGKVLFVAGATYFTGGVAFLVMEAAAVTECALVGGGSVVMAGASYKCFQTANWYLTRKPKPLEREIKQSDLSEIELF